MKIRNWRRFSYFLEEGAETHDQHIRRPLFIPAKNS